jgi:hypothetical protein
MAIPGSSHQLTGTTLIARFVAAIRNAIARAFRSVLVNYIEQQKTLSSSVHTNAANALPWID